MSSNQLPIDNPLPRNHKSPKDAPTCYPFSGLLQTTSTPNKSNATDSESDLSSETSTSVNYRLPVKSNRLVEKNNELNRSAELNDSLSAKSYLKDDLKISIDSDCRSDWLRKRRPLVADIDLEQHFDKISNSLNEQLIFNANESPFNSQSSEKAFDQSQLMNKENYCNGALAKEKHSVNSVAAMDLMSSSSSNHSPSSLDELDANKIELRSVIRNIMCKNLGSSSDKSSSTMSEEEEMTDEDDENSVDCKAKFNDIKPGMKKSGKIEIQENELNKSKEKAALSKRTLNGHADQYDSDEKEDSDQLNYDSNNSEERTDDLCSKDEQEIDRSNADPQADSRCSTKSNIKKQFGKNKTRRVSFDPLALFLDAALEGELELVRKTATQVGDRVSLSLFRIKLFSFEPVKRIDELLIQKNRSPGIQSKCIVRRRHRFA